MKVNFKKGGGLTPVIVQDAVSLRVLMLGYMNEEALEVTRQKGKVTFYSRSKGRLWMKGETSGNYLMVQDIRVDCDNDTLLIMALPAGPTCHLGTNSCFDDRSGSSFLYELESIISDRVSRQVSGSYTYQLYSKGVNKIAQKVGEEAVELIIEAKDENDNLFDNEAADLFYHLLILMKKKGRTLSDIESVLKTRHGNR